MAGEAEKAVIAGVHRVDLPVESPVAQLAKCLLPDGAGTPGGADDGH
jgi:hypothetical protein